MMDANDGNRRLEWRLFTCETCAAEFSALVRPAKTRRFCMRACRVKHLWARPDARAKLVRTGPEHHAWRGDAVSRKGGRSRALRMYAAGPCVKCGDPRGERHHKNDNTADNSPENIEILCRRCHMNSDGRMAAVTEQMRQIQPMGVAARWSR